MKPCTYRHYRMVDDPVSITDRIPDTSLILLWAVDPNTNTETERFDYPLESLVAELGGTLGLFIGFSFMMILDGCEEIGRQIKRIKPMFSVRTAQLRS